MGILEEIRKIQPISVLELTTLGNILETFNESRGTDHTVESLAESCGVDLASATRHEADVMARYVGGVLV